MPYLIGPKSEAIVPYAPTAMNSRVIEWKAKPAIATAATPISTNFRRLATKALSKRSASSPPIPERKKNGAINVAPASVINASALPPAIWNKMRNTSAVLRKLSPNAEKNWHQKRGAKRRAVIKDVDMALPPFLQL